MHLDFSLALVVVTLFAGSVWLLDKLFLRKRRLKRLSDNKPNIIVEYSNSFFPVLVLVLVVRSFLFEPFQIPSGSMLPTIKIGDFIIVNKFSYGVRLPVTHSKILAVNSPQNGDIAVFRYPLDTRTNYIKRVIAIPGDTVSFDNNQLALNGVPIERSLIEGRPEGGMLSERAYQEKLGTASYTVHSYPESNYRFPEITIPEGYYLVMGDNRDQSNDSRFWCKGMAQQDLGCISFPAYTNQLGKPLVMGLVAEQHLVGKATAVWMHWPKFFSLPSFSNARFLE